MPIYEYICQDCQTCFEMIRSIQDADAPVQCIKCHGENVKRRVSLFNASSGGRSLTGNSGCEGCSGGSCNTCGGNR